MSINFMVKMDHCKRASIRIEKYSDSEIDIEIGNSSHFDTAIINASWIRLTKKDVSSIMTYLDMYINGRCFNDKKYRVIYQLTTMIMSIEASKYTNDKLEISICNESKFSGTIISEAFIRLDRGIADSIFNELSEFIAE